MQKSIIITLFGLFHFFLFISAKAQVQGGFVITGQLKGLHDGTNIYLKGQNGDTISKAVSNGENIIFHGRLPRNGMFCFILIEDSIASKTPLGVFFLENQPVNINGTIGEKYSILVKGSEGHQQYIDFLNQMDLNEAKKREILVAISKISRQKSSDTSILSNMKKKREELIEKVKLINKERSEVIKEWIADHTASLYAPNVISIVIKSDLSLKEGEQAYENLTKEAKSSYYGVLLKEDLERMSKWSAFREGAIIPNFSITSPEGGNLFIHDIASKSKYTLIDFWASWCSPCRAEIPALKKIYDDFKHQGFNIVGISSDTKEASWRKALIEDSTSWTHGIQDKEMTVAKLFDLKAIPAYILIDTEGKMLVFDCAMSGVKSFGGGLRGQAGYKKIASLFNK